MSIPVKDEREQLDVQVALWSLPLLSNEQVPAALGISRSTWHVLKQDDDGPPCVSIGRRPFYRPRDLLQWIDRMEAKKNPGEDAGVSGEEVCA